MRTLLIASLIIALFFGCASSQSGGQGNELVVPPIEADSGLDVEVVPVDESPPPQSPEAITEDSVELAQSPLTPWFEQMAALALAALRNRPLPDVDLPLGPHVHSGPLVDGSENAPTPLPPVRVIGAVLPELEITLEGANDVAGLELSIVLGQEGLRLASVRPRSQGRSCGALPADHGIHQFVEIILEELREGRAGAMLLTPEECSELLGQARECQRIPVQIDESIGADLESLRVDLTSARALADFELDEVIFIARGPSDEFYGLMMMMSCRDGQIEVRGEPVVRIMPAPR